MAQWAFALNPMAYASCPNCGKRFRYRATAAADAPRWLKELAQSLGRGEQAVLLCLACWVEPEVGDKVEIIHPPSGQPDIRQGAEGRVVAIASEEGRPPRYAVEELRPANGSPWRCVLERRAIKATGQSFRQTANLAL